MGSTIKLQTAAQNNVDNLFSSLTKNTAKESVSEIKPKTSENEKEVIKTVTTPSEPKAENTNEKTESDYTKVGVCFNIPKHIKDMWKIYFTSHGLTMTDGLIQAVNYLKEQEEKGEVKLGAISVLKK